MRLTCPNCDAQYEVPDAAIPPAGRDVQCSNCSNTWYQHHPDHPDQPEDTADLPTKDDEPTPDAPSAPARRRLNPEVADILREEVEHETRLRSSEVQSGLENQPDLGLDTGPSVALRWRSRETRKSAASTGAKKPEPQHNLLPDLDEISSTLRASERVDHVGEDESDADAPDMARRGGFVLGFAVIVLLAAVLLLIYTNAGRIAETVPQAEPALAAYSETVTGARIWLESVVAGITSE